MGLFDWFRRRASVESAFLASLKEAEPRAKTKIALSELCAVGAQSAALSVLHAARLKTAQSARLGPLEVLARDNADLLLFEVSAWFLAEVRCHLRTVHDPDIRDTVIQECLGSRLGEARERLGAIFESVFDAGRDRFRSRVDDYVFRVADYADGDDPQQPDRALLFALVVQLDTALAGPAQLDTLNEAPEPEFDAAKVFEGHLANRLVGVADFLQRSIQTASRKYEEWLSTGSSR